MTATDNTHTYHTWVPRHNGGFHCVVCKTVDDPAMLVRQALQELLQAAESANSTLRLRHQDLSDTYHPQCLDCNVLQSLEIAIQNAKRFA